MAVRASSPAVLAALVALGLMVRVPAAPAQLPPAPVEGIAALVGGKAPGPEVGVILLSDVQLRARMHLVGRDRSRLALRPLPPDLLRAALDELVGEELISREARRIRTAEPRRRDLRAERDRLVSLCGGQARFSKLLEALAVGREELEVIVQRRALVAVFLASNLEGATVITPGEVDAALSAAGHSDPASATVMERQSVAGQLSRQALSLSVQRWVRVLRSRVPVRVYARFD